MKLRMKALAFVLALMCMISMIPAFVVSAEEAAPLHIEFTPEQTEYYNADEGKTYIIIRTPEQMNEYMALPDKAGRNNNYILANDLDYTGKNFSAICTAGTTFDGNGYAIYGFELNPGNSDLRSFGADNVGTNVLRNVTVGLPSAPIKAYATVSGKSNGFIYGYSNAKHVVENVTVYGVMESTGGNCGGLFGNIKGTMTAKNCRFYGSITNTGNPAGGIMGKANALTLTMENCVNYGNITNPSKDTGGIIGNVSGDSKGTVTGCVNFGNVNGGSTAGIIASYNPSTNATMTFTISNCVNFGSVNGSSNTGGVLGYVGAGKYVTVENCANVGSISSGGKAAGIAAMSSNQMKLDNCASFAAVAGKDTETNALLAVIPDGQTPAQATNLFYTPLTVTSTNTVTGTAKTLEEGLAYMNEKYASLVGNMLLNSDGNGIVLANPTFVGVQTSAAVEGKMKVRFVATLGDTLRYSAVGFNVTLKDQGTVNKECNSVYRKLLSTDAQGFTSEVSASDLGGVYIFALAIENVPAEGEVVFTVTPYAKDLDGTTVYNGTSYEITFNNGVYVGAARA